MSKLTKEQLAAFTDNSDVEVELSLPVFTGQTIKASIKSVDLKEYDDGSKQVHITWSADEPLTKQNGDKVQPGYDKLVDRFKVLPPPSMPNRDEAARIAYRTLGNLARDFGLLAGESASKVQIMDAIFQAEGKQALLKLSEDKGGYQSFRYAKPAEVKK